MPSTEQSAELETFEAVDAGAAETYPCEAGQIKKGSYLMMNGHPCKVTKLSIVKTGKHGHAKATFVGLDIFTNKKLEHACSTSHAVEVPNVFREEYMLVNVGESGALSLLSDDAELKSDLDLPENEALATSIRAGFEDEKQLLITVLSACGSEQVIACREDKA